MKEEDPLQQKNTRTINPTTGLYKTTNLLALYSNLQ